MKTKHPLLWALIAATAWIAATLYGALWEVRLGPRTELSPQEARKVLDGYNNLLRSVNSIAVVETAGPQFRRTWEFKKPDSYRAETRVLTQTGKLRTLYQHGSGNTSYTIDPEDGFCEKLARRKGDSPLDGFSPFFSSPITGAKVFKTHLQGKPAYQIQLKGYSLLLDTQNLLPVALNYPTETHLLNCAIF